MNYLIIDKNKLNTTIDGVCMAHNDEDPYIICGFKTFKKLMDSSNIIKTGFTKQSIVCGNVSIQVEEDERKNYSYTYRGCKVMIDDDLEFGEILVR